MLSQGTGFTGGLDLPTCDSLDREVSCCCFDVWGHLLDDNFNRDYAARDVQLLNHIPFTKKKS